MQRQTLNISSSTNLVESVLKMMLVQSLVGIFLYINCLMIFTFMKKSMFREDTRYILFAQTLFVDSAVMLLSDMMLIGTAYIIPVHMIPCIVICLIVVILNSCTPLTLVAMCLERYVAICMPLRHTEISNSTRTRLIGFFVIWSISCIPSLFTFLAYISVVNPNALYSYVFCTVELMLLEEWQDKARSILLLVFFLLLILIIAFTYIKIMLAARAASSEKKKSTNKSLKTVVLHAFQLFLCIVQFLSPYIEMPFWKLGTRLFYNVRFITFISFIIVPRCLSPLIYGLRDEKFFIVLRHYAVCGLTGFSKVRSEIRK